MGRVLGCIFLAFLLQVPKVLESPRAIRVVGIDYPPLALAARVTGTVRVKCRLDDAGNVVAAERLDRPASPLDPLGDGARANALQWKFAAADEQRRSDSIELVYRFAIEMGSKPPFRSRFVYQAPQSVDITGELPPMQVD